jgi:hypothetical protein
MKSPAGVLENTLGNLQISVLRISEYKTYFGSSEPPVLPSSISTTYTTCAVPSKTGPDPIPKVVGRNTPYSGRLDP